MNREPGLRYDIQRGPGGWTWRALGDNGVTAAHGRADTRALAAACIVHAIASAVAPQEAGPRKHAA